MQLCWDCRRCSGGFRWQCAQQGSDTAQFTSAGTWSPSPSYRANQSSMYVVEEVELFSGTQSASEKGAISALVGSKSGYLNLGASGDQKMKLAPGEKSY
jgi:hypothetical protein